MLRITFLSSLVLASPALAQEVIFGNGRVMVDANTSGVKFAEITSLAVTGDPKAIKPAFDMIKSEMADSVNRDRQFKDAARTLGLFGYREAIDSLVPLLGNQQLGPTTRDEVLIALSRMNDKKLIPVLKRELTSYRSLTARSHAARSLVELGEPEGRPFLLTELQAHLDELENARQFRTGVRDVLKLMADQELVDSIAAMAERQKTEVAKTNVASLVNAMRLNLRPTAEIVIIAQDPAWAKKDDRYTALAAIGERGTSAEIPTLLELKAWDGVEGDAAQQRYDLRAKIVAAIGRIQARHWQQLEESKTPLVTNAQRRLEELHGDPPMQVRPGRPVARPLIR